MSQDLGGVSYREIAFFGTLLSRKQTEAVSPMKTLEENFLSTQLLAIKRRKKRFQKGIQQYSLVKIPEESNFKNRSCPQKKGRVR